MKKRFFLKPVFQLLTGIAVFFFFHPQQLMHSAIRCHGGSPSHPNSLILFASRAWATPDDKTGLNGIVSDSSGFNMLLNVDKWLQDEVDYVKTYRYFERGLSRMKGGDLNGAAEDFEMIIHRDPDNLPAHLYLSQIELQKGSPAEAAEILKTYLKQFGDNGYVHMRLGFLFVNLENDARAIAHLEKAVHFIGDDALAKNTAITNLAELYYKNKKHAEALDHYILLKDRLPADGLLYYKIGLCLKALNRNKAAIEYCRKALNAHGLNESQRIACQMDLSMLLTVGGFINEAIQQLEQVIGNDTASDDMRILARSQLMEVYYRAGKYDKALAQYQLIEPENISQIQKIAAAYCEKHLLNNDRAMTLFLEVLGSNALTAVMENRIQVELADLYIRSGEKSKASVLLKGVLESKDAESQIMMRAKHLLSDLYSEKGNLEQALSLQMSLYRGESDFYAAFKAYDTYLSMGNYHMAEQLINELIKRDDLPADLQLRAGMALGFLLLHLDKLTAAETVFEDILTYQKPDASQVALITENLAEIKFLLNKIDAARILAESAYEKNPQISILFLRGMIHARLFVEGTPTNRSGMIGRVTENLNLRSEPNQNKPPIITLPKGTAVGIIQQGGRWLKVVWEGKTGYVRNHPRYIHCVLNDIKDDVDNRVGTEWFSLRDFKKAEDMFNQVLSNPETTASLKRKTYIALGNLYLSKDDLQKAETVFETTVNEYPGDIYSMKTLMEIFKKLNNKQAVLSYARKIEEIDTSETLQTELANTMDELGEPVKAMALFEKALERKPSSEAGSEIYKRMGFLSLKLGDRESAIHFFQQSLMLSEKKDPYILEQLAGMYIHADNCHAAITLLKDLTLIRTNQQDQVTLARCLEATGDNRGAIESYQSALDLFFNADIVLELVATAEKSEGMKKAAEILKNLLEEKEIPDTEKFRVYLTLSKYHWQLGNEIVQKVYAEKALLLASGNTPPDEMVYLMIIAGVSGPFLDAYEKDIKALKAPEPRAVALAEFAEWYDSAGKFDKAIELLNLAVKSHPSSAIRLKRGHLLYRNGFYEMAKPELFTILDHEPIAALYLADISKQQEKSGLAIDYLEKVLKKKDALTKADRIRVVEQLAYLYFNEGQIEKSLSAVEKSYAEGSAGSTKLLITKARCLILLGYCEDAIHLATKEIPKTEAPEELSEWYEVIGKAERSLEQYETSNQNFIRSLTYNSNNASVCHLLANNYYRLKNFEESRKYYKKALSLDPDNPEYQVGYAFALVELREYQTALDIFEAYLSVYPHALTVLEQAAYLNMLRCNNARAEEQFKDAIDQNRRRLTYRPVVEIRSDFENHIYSLKSNVLNLSKRFSFSFSLNRMDLIDNEQSRIFRGIIPSQTGLEVGWRPPVIGFRDQRIFEITARITGNFKEESWSYDQDSTQFMTGIRYKPFKKWNAFFSFEKLIKWGDNSENNWLLRGMASENWGLSSWEGPTLGHTGSVYLDYGIFLENNNPQSGDRRESVYGEVKEGVAFYFNQNWGVVPHLVVDFHWDDTGNAMGKYLEGGFGLELMGWMHDTAYRPGDWKFSFILQHKWGTFKVIPPGEDDKTYHGFVVGTSITH